MRPVSATSPGAAAHALTPSPSTFVFDVPDLCAAAFHFKPLAAPELPAKRRRSVCDVDGEGSSPLQKKKQRLRLDLITSRLSRPYANPSTFIGSRGSCKAARWARLRRAGAAAGSQPRKISLRKAALVNWTRLRKRALLGGGGGGHRAFVPPAVEVGPLAIRDGDDGLVRGGAGSRESSPPPPVLLLAPGSPPRHGNVYAPPRPSPLGLSNYQALDEEDPFDYIDDDWDGLVEDEEPVGFNVREPEDEPGAVEDSPSLDPSSQLFEVAGARGSVLAVLAGENCNGEISFASFHSVLPG